MIWLLAFAVLSLGTVAVAAIFVLRDLNLKLHEQIAEARKDRQSLTNSLLRDLNKPVFPDAPTQVKATQQWFTGRTVLVPPQKPDNEQQ